MVKAHKEVEMALWSTQLKKKRAVLPIRVEPRVNLVPVTISLQGRFLFPILGGQGK